MRVWLERLGYELAVPPVNLRGRTRIHLDSEHAIERALISGIDAEEADTLRRLLLELGGIGVWELAHRDVIARLTDHIRLGRIWVLELEQLSASVAEETELEEHDVEVKTRHWIEVQLIDEIGAPVSGARYQITLPDGKIRKGSTNAKGVVRFNNIESGVCDFSFVKLDKEAYEPA